MTGHQMRRGLALAATTALALTGIPAIVGAAHAETLTQAAESSGGATAVRLVTFDRGTTTASTLSDKQDNWFRLEAIAGSGVSQVRFEYQTSGGTRTPIATVTSRNDDGAFFTPWTPTGSGAVTVYAVGLDGGGAPVIGPAAQDSASATIDNTAQTVNLDSGVALGVFQQPYTGMTADYAIVTGSASDNSGIDLGWLDGSSWVERADAAAAPTGGGAWVGHVNLDGYNYAAAGGTDQVMVGADNDVTDDTEAYALYQQTLSKVTATAEDSELPAGQSTTVTVTVTDQNQRPVYGAQVYSSKGAGPQYTDEKGQATFTQGAGTASAAYYYANTTANTAYEAGTDPKSDTVGVASYDATPTALEPRSEDGPAFDLDEYKDGDITVQVTDQRGADYNPSSAAPQTLSYYWVFTPFGGTAQRIPANGTSSQPTEDDGEYVVPLPNPPGNSDSGTYELFAGLSATPGGEGAIAQSKLATYTAGQSALTYDEPSPQQATAGGQEVVSGKLALENGTGLPGRSVRLTLAYNQLASLTDDSSPDAVLLGADSGSNGLVKTVTTGDGGAFSATVDDPAENPQPTEIGDTLTASTVAGTSDNDDPNPADAAQRIDFVASTTPKEVTITGLDGTSAAPLSAGELDEFEVCVTDGVDSDPITPGVQGTPLSNQTVTLTTDHGYFTDGQDQSAASGGDAGVFDNDGKSKQVTTGNDGCADAAISIGRDSGFDDDGDVAAAITASSGTVSKSATDHFTSEDPINGGSVTLDFAPAAQQESTVLPKAEDSQSVRLLVKTFDQFGNRVGGESVTLTEDAANASVTSPVTTDYDENPDSTATATGPGDQKVTATWTTPRSTYADTDSNPATPPVQQGGNETLTDDLTIEWYAAQVSDATVTMDDNTGGEAAVGETVTETVTVKDQFGQPVEGYTVQFFRSGTSDGEPAFTSPTNANGRAQYVFSQSSAGTANITAVVRDESSSVVATKYDTVRFGTTRAVIDARLSGANNGAKADVLTVNGPNSARGATVRLYRYRANGTRVLLQTKTANRYGNAAFTVRDLNGRTFTKYRAYVGTTPRTRADWTNYRSVR